MCFKGDRDYAHGPDLYLAALSAARWRLGAGAWIDRITFSTMVRTDCEIVERLVEGCAASVSVRSGSEAHRWSIVATPNPIELRDDYDEDGMVSAAQITGDRIELGTRSRATAAEEIVALAKRLHQHLRPRLGFRWIVVGFRFDEPLETRAPGPFTVELVRSLGDTLTVSRILVQGRSIGEVTFARFAKSKDLA